MEDRIPIKRALISVSDKLGLANFAQGLAGAGVKIYSTGGTRRFLEEAGIRVEDVSAYTGFPEMMEGRIKTLHPKIHAGILARRDQPEDRKSLDEHAIVTFDLVVVNLYPFETTVAKPDVADEEAIEQIDIGGPTLIRAAAKNHRFVAVATSPDQYAEILEQVGTTGGTTLGLRRQLATAAFVRTGHYDKAISDYFLATTTQADFPPRIQLELHRKAVLRYGENPHQRGALYSLTGCGGANLVSAHQLHGKELSYNNLLDLDSALAIVRTLPGAAAVVIKHNNPCGAATAASLDTAMRRALDGDPVSAFGSVIGVNQPLNAATAEVLVEPDRFVEAMVAPSFETAAVEILTTRPKWKANVRLLEVGRLGPEPESWQLRQIAGGMLVQDADAADISEAEWRVVTTAKPTPEEMSDLRLAWILVAHVKSNAITVVKDGMLLGVGAGQMSRVDSVGIALRKAGSRAAGAVLASDAFFPFDDSIPPAAAAGIKAIIQPGGSRRDEDVTAACNSGGIAMVFTGRRHFKH
jgi:phosphoribosylaminoimidazolecarboxamide formyltransferase/IMP cyclohydrolase